MISRFIRSAGLQDIHSRLGGMFYSPALLVDVNLCHDTYEGKRQRICLFTLFSSNTATIECSAQDGGEGGGGSNQAEGVKCPTCCSDSTYVGLVHTSLVSICVQYLVFLALDACSKGMKVEMDGVSQIVAMPRLGLRLGLLVQQHSIFHQLTSEKVSGRFS